jgi:hypothetical protein
MREEEFVIVSKGELHRELVKEPTKFLMIGLEGALNKENYSAMYCLSIHPFIC